MEKELYQLEGKDLIPLYGFGRYVDRVTDEDPNIVEGLRGTSKKVMLRVVALTLYNMAITIPGSQGLFKLLDW